jgi:cytochrome c-type biogenesis protein CcmH/NrfG
VEFAFAVIVLALAVAFVVIRPLVRASAHEAHEVEERAVLEAAKEAKYREIRDAELDLRTGKLSEDDWRRTDRELRAQAIRILRKLDELAD